MHTPAALCIHQLRLNTKKTALYKTLKPYTINTMLRALHSWSVKSTHGHLLIIILQCKYWKLEVCKPWNQGAGTALLNTVFTLCACISTGNTPVFNSVVQRIWLATACMWFIHVEFENSSHQVHMCKSNIEPCDLDNRLAYWYMCPIMSCTWTFLQ